MAVKTNERRLAILEACLQEFESRGMAAARMEDIARRAGVAKGTLYNYFDSKEDLLLALAKSLLETMQQRIAEQAGLKDVPLRRRIETLVAPILENNGRNRFARTMQVIWSEGLHRPDVTDPFVNRHVLPLMTEKGPLRDLLADGGLPQTVKDYPLLLASPLIHAVLLQGLQGGDLPFDLKAFYSRYLDMVFSGQ